MLMTPRSWARIPPVNTTYLSSDSSMDIASAITAWHSTLSAVSPASCTTPVACSANTPQETQAQDRTENNMRHPLLLKREARKRLLRCHARNKCSLRATRLAGLPACRALKCMAFDENKGLIRLGVIGHNVVLLSVPLPAALRL